MKFIQIMHKELNNNGLTLVEILVAIFIFSTLITLLFGSYKMVFSTSHAIQADVPTYEMAFNCLSIMRKDLTNIYITPKIQYKKPEFTDPPDDYQVLGQTISLTEQESGQLNFTSFNHLAFNHQTAQGIAQIAYYPHLTDENELVLRRKDQLFPYSDFAATKLDPILCDNLYTIKFTYFDDENEEFDSWDSDAEDFDYATPRAIKIELTIGNEEKSLLFATMINLPVYRERQTEK